MYYKDSERKRSKSFNSNLKRLDKISLINIYIIYIVVYNYSL